MVRKIYLFKVFPVVLMCVLLLNGCGKSVYPALPDNPIAFEVGSYEGERVDDGTLYGTIEYEDRVYMMYGTLKGVLHDKDISECVGYIVQDENITSVPDPNDRDTRIYTLKNDSEHNFLMEYYVGDTLMNQPCFWRAIDTKGKDIAVPKFIDSLEYGFGE